MDYIKFLKYVNLEDHRIDDLLSLSSHNGPYYDEETKVRLLSHYIIAYCKFSKVKDTERFNQLILSMAQELCDEKYRPDGYTFLCRMGNKKDKTNGVIGQAWVIEALVELYVYFGEGKYLDLAKRIFLMHPYDSKIGGWHCVSIEGKIMPCDMTFNHQLWFAAAGAMINAVDETKEVRKCLVQFMDKLESNLKTHRNGLIVHKLKPCNFVDKVKFDLKQIRDFLRRKVDKPNMKYKEIGYHSFNLYGFALLKAYYGDHTFFESSKFKKAMLYSNTKEYFTGLRNSMHGVDINSKNMSQCNVKCNRYAYSYNVTGLEMVYIYKILGKYNLLKEETVNSLFNEQLKYTYNKVKGSFDNTEDDVIVNARIYELLRAYEVKDV